MIKNKKKGNHSVAFSDWKAKIIDKAYNVNTEKLSLLIIM